MFDLQALEPVCGYLSVAIQEVNKVVSLCSDPIVYPVHIFLCREMTKYLPRKQFTYRLVEEHLAHASYSTFSSQNYLERVDSRPSEQKPGNSSFR